MLLTQIWPPLVILLVSFLLGGLPLIGWLTKVLTRQELSQLGTGNVSVSAAFYHGGWWVGSLAVLSEAFKGIAAVGLARFFFPTVPVWELVALIALVLGRYWIGKGAGTTNVVWGYIAHDWVAAGLVFLIGGISFTLLRERQKGRIGVLILFPLIAALLHPHQEARILAVIVLASLLGWIYHQMPDDLDLSPGTAATTSQPVFRFFRGERAVASLNQSLKPDKVGQKAATLAELKRWGYPVPMGWVLAPGDDPAPLLTLLQPSEQTPLVVRSSAIGEDSEQASAAGQYTTVLGVTSQSALEAAIASCLASYDEPAAVQYRRDRGLPEDAMAVLIQPQVQAVFSGVAFSRDPITRQGNAVVIEALPGGANRIVSGQTTPEQYQVLIQESDLEQENQSWLLPAEREFPVEGTGELPPRLIQQVAFLARHLERRYHGVPQDIEWSYDGQTLWLLQARPITTLLPLWTRKIAAEVIPGLIRPLTWSVNRPLTCGVWGELFSLVLGDRAEGLDFNQTATLLYSHAYFNASLLGQIFRRMGLPPESLEFLTRGAKFSKPPLASTLRNVPGLLKLVQRELSLVRDFNRDYNHVLEPALASLRQQPATELTPAALLARVDLIQSLLKRATYYSILAPLSASLRQALLRVEDAELDYSQTPEVAALRSLRELADAIRPMLPQINELAADRAKLFDSLAGTEVGEVVAKQLDQFLSYYGYLSEVGTDIAVTTWREDPQVVYELLTQFLFDPPPASRLKQPVWKAEQVQRRVNLKGKVTEVYSRLLAELRWSFVALEQLWLEAGLLTETGDIFFLQLQEIHQIVQHPNSATAEQIPKLIAERRAQREQDHQLTTVPFLVYGNLPPVLITSSSQTPSSQQLQGIGASPGQVEGRVRVLRSLQAVPEIGRDTILVVPYTDSGWAPLLARAGGLISEVGGRLSHGAIVAREYGIPAVMDIAHATQYLQNGQWVRIDGQRGTVDIF